MCLPFASQLKWRNYKAINATSREKCDESLNPKEEIEQMDEFNQGNPAEETNKMIVVEMLKKHPQFTDPEAWAEVDEITIEEVQNAINTARKKIVEKEIRIAKARLKSLQTKKKNLKSF